MCCAVHFGRVRAVLPLQWTDRALKTMGLYRPLGPYGPSILKLRPTVVRSNPIRVWLGPGGLGRGGPFAPGPVKPWFWMVLLWMVLFWMVLFWFVPFSKP